MRGVIFMAYEIGGRADKFGNRYEYNWIIHKILDVAEEKITYVLIEAIGDDEQGVDLWLGNNDGSFEAQQCKARCGSDEYWTYGSANEKGIFLYWKKQLSRNEKIFVSLVSPLSFSLFEDITKRARNSYTESPDLFYEVQIKQSGSKTRALFKNICDRMEIQYGSEAGNLMALDYFSRMRYRQIPDDELKEFALRRIDMLFSQDKNHVYARLLSFVLTEDILGKSIDRMELHRFLHSNGISYRNLSDDNTIWPQIINLNNEYSKSFAQLSCGILNREASEECIDYIEKGKSIIIHGNAGMGKSGCTENIIYYCSENDIPYVAIKLDKHLPVYNSRKWGEILGLPASLSHCINAVSTFRRAVIILDQLDALRWTQSKSSVAITVCSEIINEIAIINTRREVPISMVLACRTYDIEHDFSIKNMISSKEENGLQWEKVCVDVLKEDTVRGIVGDSYYNEMSPRMKTLLRIVSNLFIWEHLNNNRLFNVETTTQLVAEWWSQISLNAYKHGIESQELESLKEKMVAFCYRNGRMIIPRSIIRNKEQALAYLASNGILWADDSRAGFVHQSILDSFLSEKMMQKYYDGDTLSEIIGDRSKQTPGRRYQTQLFLQQLADYQTDDLIEFGEKLLSSEVRYSIKHAFLEILAQFDHPDEYIKEYVCKKVEIPKWKMPFINTVIRRNIDFVRCLRDKGIFDNWMKDESLCNNVVDLLASIAPEYDETDLLFIRKYVLLEESNRTWDNCFFTEVSAGSDLYFELKLSYYKKHPELLKQIYNITEMLSSEESRTLRIIALMLEISNENPEQNNYEWSETRYKNAHELNIVDYNACFDLLFPLFPEISDKLRYSGWSTQYGHRYSLKRMCVHLVKKAARLMAQREPGKLLNYYKAFMGTGSRFYNELILDAFCYFPDSYADHILDYLCDSIELNSIEDTSESESELSLAFTVVSRFGTLCNDIVFKKLENSILKYQPGNMVQHYKRRIDNNTNAKEYGRAYWPFWGYYQLEMLAALPKNRMSKEALDTLSMLKRNMDINYSWYRKSSYFSRGGRVVSPIHGKTISSTAWKSILCNPKIVDRKHTHCKYVRDLCIESSLEEFASSFQSYASEYPKDAIKLALIIKDPIAKQYIDSLYSGLAFSKKQEEYSVTDVEALFEKFEYDLDSFRAAYICEIIEKKKMDNWSDTSLNMVRDIAANHSSPQIDNPVVYSDEDKTIKTCEMLESNALNCVRGYAARAISGLLWEQADLYSFFKSTIEAMTMDPNPVIRYASLWCLAPILNIDQGWAVDHMISILKEDYRCLAGNNMRWVFCRYYGKYQTVITNVISEAMKSGEDRVLREAGYSIAELFLINDFFEEYLMNPECIDQKIRRHIVEMLILYLDVEKYKEKSKKVLCQFALVEDDTENEFIWSRIFSENKIDIDADNDFVSCILQSKISRRLIEEFGKYIERHHCTKEHSRELLDMCKNALDCGLDNKTVWGFENIIAKTIISVYYNNVEVASAQQKEIVNECLDIWDLMYEKDFGMARQLTRQMLEI